VFLVLKKAIMDYILDSGELEVKLGEAVRAVRLQRNLDQISLAKQAGISVTALKHLESGQGATVKTLVKIVRALGRNDWIMQLAPVVSINPLHMVKEKKARQRAGRKARGKKETL
jgi:transcriptional regulator with XRE-family HTH domain